MNNEPVAWMIQYKDRHKFVFEKPTYSEHILACEPLYTHPVKEQLTEIELEATFNRGYKEGARDYASKCNPVKELTDEEILQAIRRGFARDGFLSDGIFLEIKELLRKAQEK